jgi:tRNA A-37 threonylcarbamoyl transferase component Bud32
MIERETRRVTARRTGLWTLFPRFEESVSPEFYRFTGKIRVLGVLALIAANVVSGLQVERLALDETVYWRLVAFHGGVHVAVLFLGLALWKGDVGLVGMRRLTYASMILETTTTVVVLWVFGSVTSHMLIFAAVLVLVYRIAFDFRVGVTAFLIVVIGHWTVAVLEMTGTIPAQPLAVDRVDNAYLVVDRQLTSMIIITILMALTFVVANWSVARLRHKELAIRMLRESLYAGDAGHVGRHTGRSLCERYVVGRLLGTGGMGEVYAGEHRKTKRRVAIKLLHPHLAEDETVLKRFQREAEVTGRLGSEHIVEIIDVDSDDGQPFLVLELMEGESLSARIASRGLLELAEARAIVEQLARGLQVAHEAGVVHRDLKPENVFLCRHADGRLLVKILDFGVSKIRGNATQITQEVAILGTPDFMSPEQAIGRVDEVDASTDMFAFGGLVYFAITGRRPFFGSSVPALLRAICDEEPIPVRELRASAPEAVEAVLAIALAKRPDERYATPLELARDFGAALDGNLDPRVRERAARVHRGVPAARTVTGDPSVNPAANTQLA